MTSNQKTILVPVNFDGSERGVIETAKWLSRALEADVALLYVHDRPEFNHPELPGELIAQVQEAGEQAARTSLANLAAEAGATRAIFCHGDPATRILDIAREVAPTMVVMGTRGRGGLERFLMGSVAADVVRACCAPVVTVRCPVAARS